LRTKTSQQEELYSLLDYASARLKISVLAHQSQLFWKNYRNGVYLLQFLEVLEFSVFLNLIFLRIQFLNLLAQMDAHPKLPSIVTERKLLPLGLLGAFSKYRYFYSILESSEYTCTTPPGFSIMNNLFSPRTKLVTNCL